MVTVEDKIRTFSKYVYEKEVKKSNQIIKEVEDKNKELLESKKQDISTKYALLEEKVNKRIEGECQKILSEAKMDAKSKSLQIKRELLDTFIQEIISSLVSFRDDKEYTHYFNKIVDESSEFLSQGKVRLFLIERDIKQFGSEIKLKHKEVEILQMSDENIGGLIIQFVSTNERMDFSIRRKVNEWKNEIGLRLYEALEKQVK